MGAVMRNGVLTSAGDVQEMNAAVRAVVRTGLRRGAEARAITEGYKGMVEGESKVRPKSWRSVSGIIQPGGTVIGTARSEAFRKRTGRRRAATSLAAPQSLELIGLAAALGSLGYVPSRSSRATPVGHGRVMLRRIGPVGER
jgi:6-phosphofructokinase